MIVRIYICIIFVYIYINKYYNLFEPEVEASSKKLESGGVGLNSETCSNLLLIIVPKDFFF